MNASRNHPISCGLAATAAFARAFAKRSVSARSFDIAAAQRNRITAQASQSSITLDKDGGSEGAPLKKYQRHLTASFVSDFAVAAEFRQSNYFQPVSFSSSSTVTLGNPQGYIASHVSDGPCTLFATSRDGEVSAVGVTAVSGGPSNIDTPDGWASGALAAHCTGQMDTLAASGNDLSAFTVANGSTFVRNPSFWASAIDLSCASPWNGTGGSQRAGTLVSPRHVVFCEHASFYPANGATMYFASAQGEVVTRTLHSTVYGAGDLRVGLLSSDVPPSIRFARVLPSDWESYLPEIEPGFIVPVIALNQRNQAVVLGISRMANSAMFVGESEAYADVYQAIAVGDSGKPMFLVVDGDAVLVSVFSSAGSGSNIAHYTTEVNAAMTTLGGGYSLTTVDLSEFPDYS